jgi:hypothetical protein
MARKINHAKAHRTRMQPSDLIRFLGKIDVDEHTGCWIWNACKDDSGYGQFRWAGRAYWAHRIAYVNFKRPIPDLVQIDHKKPCHNPSCVNPDHLRALSHSANAADANRRRAEDDGSGVPF